VFKRYPETPLYAAFFCVILTTCSVSEPPPAASQNQCPQQTAAIADIQGDGRESSMTGQRVTVQGVVTLIQNGKGLFIEDSSSDTNRHTSNAIFIQSEKLPDGVKAGSLIGARGMVSEIGENRDPLTALTDLSELKLCSNGNSLPLTDVSLPLDGPARESLEGMRIRINDSLVVTDAYQFKQGLFTLSSNGFQFVPTEIMNPGPATADLLAQNKTSALPVYLPEGMGFPTLVVAGTAVDEVVGVLAQDNRGKRLTLLSISTFYDSNTPLPEAASPNALRVVGMNLHNYFNGDGKGKGFPTPRGAETFGAFQKQRDRIGAAIGVLDPDVLAVMELENDGFGPDSAAQDFIKLAEKATQKGWAVTRPLDDNTGTDQITVGLFYRTDRLTAVGAAETLGGPEFKRSRQPQAQLFRQLSDGQTLLIVINHLKSKGSCPDFGVDTDQKDGQGCWNDMRRVSAENMSAWANQVAASKGTDNILILGDMNAYRNEDPIVAIRNSGFTELMEVNKQETYSFVFYGQRGTLDYAFTSDALLGQVQQAYIWHVNAAFPANMELPRPWLGFSDHDPVVVELSLRQSSTSD